jgi:chromosome segregation ATPase
MTTLNRCFSSSSDKAKFNKLDHGRRLKQVKDDYDQQHSVIDFLQESNQQLTNDYIDVETLLNEHKKQYEELLAKYETMLTNQNQLQTELEHARIKFRMDERKKKNQTLTIYRKPPQLPPPLPPMLPNDIQLQIKALSN